MKVLFLDCDGVLNCDESFKPTFSPITGEKIFAYDPIDPDKMERLNQIVAATDCVIVISSAWRVKYTVEQFRLMFVQAGFVHAPEKIFDVTPRNHERIRGEEIADWLGTWAFTTNESLEGICALDDSDLFPNYEDVDYEVSARWSSYLSLIRNNFVRTTMKDGLQDVHVAECIRRLNVI